MPDASKSTIPPPLLQRLVQAHTTEPKTRISKPALEAFGEFVDTFVKEAIYRAADEAQRKEKERDGDFNEPTSRKGKEKGLDTAVSGASVFLEVEDLEKIAPQLVLDF